ncbi:hypothetical protein QFZ82_007059 [Streptomyces sp. V4I23]|uniref:eCIS core domain-containing protein n=1 Tax=Streptomyces sp. V4I23 TaxID=3042282 RepID=UPI002780C650|nr:DUF4157 domain-containing protein [Streptomyces sp. V4I23]MDQ1012574.1 hypothetical protein [Streptomyces sp. V4I23]
MSTSHSQESRTDQSGKRRKRKDRSASRAPEPKNIVSGAGQPLDVSVRRELEEQLGHDFGRVRLHTDRDAGALTEMLGADAVAVGQDIFFREGAYRPGTADGQRLLAHELLHTVQNPHGLGALRAGRDLGAVSLPQQATEREAESAAQESVGSTHEAGTGAAEEGAAVAEGQATPGWLRYATVDADLMRAEQLDPDTVVDRLVNGVLRSLRGDPADASGRVRLQLAKMSSDLQDAVLDRLETRLPTPEHSKLIDLVDEVDQDPLPLGALSAPHGVADTVEEIEQERQSEEDTWRALLEQGEQLENDRIRAAQRRKAEDPKTDDGAAGGARAPEDGVGRSTPADGGQTGAAQQGRRGEQVQQDATEAKSLRMEGKSEGADKSPGGAQDTGATRDGKDGPPQAESEQPQGSAKPRRAEDKTKESSALQAGAMRPEPVDKSAAERNEARTPAERESDDASGQGPDSAESSEDEGGGTEAVAELEDMLADAEAEEDADADAASATDQDALTPEALDASTDSARTQPVGKGSPGGTANRPSESRMSAEDAEALASSLDEMDEEATAEAEPESPEADAADSDSDTAEKDTEDAAQSKGEAQDRELASETGKANTPAIDDAGQEGTTPSGSGKLAKAEDDARGQAAPAGGSGGGAGSGTGGASAGGGSAPAKAASAAPAANAVAAAPAPVRPAPGGDTGVTPAADEVRSAPPRAEAPPKHQPARQDDDKPVSVKAAPRGRSAGGAGGGGGGGGGAGGGGGGGGGAGGGSGRSAAKPKKAASAPNVSNATPEAGLAAASGLKPHLALTTLKGVNGAVGRSVSKERGELKGAPPTMERPVGSPKSLRGGPKPSAPGSYTTQRVGETEAAQGSTPEIKGEKTPSGELPGGDAKEPSWWDIGKTIAFALGKKVLSKLLPLDRLMGSIDDLPTTDKGLQGAKVGDAPKLPLKDDSDPERTGKQAKLLEDKSAELHASGRDDAARPMGEDQIFPDVPKETLTAKIGGGKRPGSEGGGPAGAPGAGLPVEAVSAVAEHEQGPQIKHAFGQARQKMTAARKEKETKAGQDRRQYQRNVKREIDISIKEQATARDRGRSEITRSRAGWRKEQDDKLSEIDGKKGKQYTQARKDIKEKQEKTDSDVDQRTKDDQKKIDDQRTGAEKEVVRKRDEEKKDSRNWFEKGLDWIKEQFNKLKKAIKDVFEKARNLVKGVIEEFKKQVFTFIDEARKWVIDKINKFADALIRLGDELLKDYPAMRDKWRKTINGLRDAAVKKVNEVADKLKDIAGKLIDAFGDILLAGLDLLEKGLLTAVSIAETVTVKAMEMGAALLKGLGEWAAIATDILSDPGGWIGKAKDAAVTGAKQHLFTEIKAAVKEWFNQKVQQLIGIPMEMFNRLVKGGTSKEEMAKMAWDAALPQLPLIIGELIVTKVVAKLIPGAGWVMAIIDALKTAYDALGAILRAFGMFMTFLKSVKSGNGALPFAKAVASGVVALLELIYQWLVSGVGKYLGKVGKALRDRAGKLGGKDKGPDPKKDQDKDPKKEQEKNPERDPKTGPPRRQEPAPRPAQPTRPKRTEEPPAPGRKTEQPPAKDKDRNKEDDDRSPTSRPRPVDRTDPRRPDNRDGGPGSRRPGDRRPDGKRPDPAKPKDKDPGSRKPAKDGKRPNKDAPGQKRKPADSKQKPKKPSLLSRVRDAVRNALAKVRKALRRLGNKARQLLNKLKNFARRLKELWRRLKNRLRRAADRRRDKRRPDERDTKQPVDLPKVPFTDADDGEHHMLRFHGRGPRAPLYIHSDPKEVPPFLDDWEKDLGKPEAKPYKAAQQKHLSAANKAYEVVEKIHATTPSSATEEELKRLKRQRLAALEREMRGFAGEARKREYFDIPKDKLQDFSDVNLSSDKDRRPNESHESRYIGTPTKTAFGGSGQEAGDAKWDQPPGWLDVTDNRGLGEGGLWVRMHLLPERLGGKASGNNLVPARGSMNKEFYQDIEKEAYNAIPSPFKIIWYKSGARFAHPNQPQIPSYIWAEYGGYEKIRGTGKDRRDWRELGRTKYKGEYHKRIADNEKSRLEIRKVGSPTVYGRLLERNWPNLATHFVDARNWLYSHSDPSVRTTFKSPSDVREGLKKYKREVKPGISLEGLSTLTRNLSKLDRANEVDWG